MRNCLAGLHLRHLTVRNAFYLRVSMMAVFRAQAAFDSVPATDLESFLSLFVYPHVHDMAHELLQAMQRENGSFRGQLVRTAYVVRTEMGIWC